MRRIKEKIYDHLYACQQQFGGYTGKDIEEIARYLGFDRKTIKRDLEK
jgi:ActR/RegA family two-component response regulator